jgi:hypothetical protein
LLGIIETWGVIFETWWIASETCFKISTSTMFAYTFTSFGLRSISYVYVMWASCFFICSLFELSVSTLSQTWMP